MLGAHKKPATVSSPRFRNASTSLAKIFCFFNDTAPTEIYTLSLHDALPIYATAPTSAHAGARTFATLGASLRVTPPEIGRHTSELQSRVDLVCRLLLEK